MTLWVIRCSFLVLCTLAGYAISALQPDLLALPFGPLMGFGLGGLLIAIDEMLKGFSLRAFSAATFGLLLGSMIAWLMDRSNSGWRSSRSSTTSDPYGTRAVFAIPPTPPASACTAVRKTTINGSPRWPCRFIPAGLNP